MSNLKPKILCMTPIKHLKGVYQRLSEFGEADSSELVKFSHKNNVIITPHVGGMAIEGQTKAYMWAVSKFKEV